MKLGKKVVPVVEARLSDLDPEGVLRARFIPREYFELDEDVPDETFAPGK